MKKLAILTLFASLLFSCKEKGTTASTADLDHLAQQYVRLALVIGQYDGSFVDAYYGPDSLKPATGPGAVFPKDSLLTAVKSLRAQVLPFTTAKVDTALQHRAGWIDDQLISFDRRIKIYSGETATFDEESRDLFGAVAPIYDEAHFQALVTQLDSLLPGDGNIIDRFLSLANRFIIPSEKVDTVFKEAIAESRKRTLVYFDLPPEEDFRLEYVNNKSWSGYNWYKGKYQSLIQINTDMKILVDRAIDVGSHESYPGHHVYNMLMERDLFNGKGLTEISLYPLFSPQSLIAEGTANYGIEMAFPGKDKTVYARDILLPLAGLDTAGIALYFEALIIKGKLNYVRNEVGRKMLSGAMTEAEAKTWLKNYGLYNDETAAKSIAFIKENRSYVINYNYGLDLVRSYIDKKSGGSTDLASRWKVFGDLLSDQVRIAQLK